MRRLGCTGLLTLVLIQFVVTAAAAAVIIDSVLLPNLIGLAAAGGYLLFWRLRRRGDDGSQAEPSRVENFLQIAFGGTVVLLLAVVTPLFVLIGSAWGILHHRLGLSAIVAGLIAVPIGLAGTALIYWAVGTGRLTLDD